jgi:hypothetical protein
MRLATRLRKHTADDWTGSTKPPFPTAVLVAMTDEPAHQGKPHSEVANAWVSSRSPTDSEVAFARGKRRSNG